MEGTPSSPPDGCKMVPPMPTALLYEVETDPCRKNSSGNDFVDTFTAPPVKSPGLSGVKDFDVTTFSMRFDGKRSRATLCPSGSVLGRLDPLSCVCT